MREMTARLALLLPFVAKRDHSGLKVPTVLFLLFFTYAVSASWGDPVVYTFEDLPDAYFYSSGDQNIGTYYAGIDFEPDVTGLSVSRFGGYDDSGFPPHSGDVVIWDATDATIDISFDSPLESFGIWYTSYDPLTLDVYDSSDNLLGEVVGDPNTDGTTGTSSFLSFSGSGIQSVELTSTPGFFVLDDMTIDTGESVTPEPSSLALGFTSAFLILLMYRWRYKNANR